MNIPYNSKLKRVVIIGSGFGGLQVAKNLNKKKFQIILIDKNNYHTFQPLLYQVATSGLEADSIVHSIRSIFRKTKNFFFRKINISNIDTKQKKIFYDIGEISYDYLVIATGSKTNYFGNENIKRFSIPMKSVVDAINLRNCILQSFENALSTDNIKERKKLMNFVIIGGGPTGIELAGAFAEFKKYIMPDDYPDLDIENIMSIHLIQATSRLLDNMSVKSSKIVLNYLNNMGVNIWLNTIVNNYDGNTVHTDTLKLHSYNVIWAAGVKGSLINGINKNSIEKNRFLVDFYNRIYSYKEIFAIGDVALMKVNKNYPNGYPMTVQPAVQQAVNLAKNLNNLINNKKMKPFKYNNLGSMAIIGRNKAVFEFSFLRISGIIAWLIWIIIHIIKLLGFRNKMVVLINWIIQYFKYNKEIRLIIKSSNNKK